MYVSLKLLYVYLRIVTSVGCNVSIPISVASLKLTLACAYASRYNITWYSRMGLKVDVYTIQA